MTWNDFKSIVDSAIAEQGHTGDIGIWYIDVHDPGEDMGVAVEEKKSYEGETWYELSVS